MAKILIVDDEEDIIELLEYNLKKEGFKVCTAADGKEAIEVARKEKPDLILLDIMLPQMDGVETCRRLRALPDGTFSYIVFLTARSEEYSEIAGLEAGADDYITKPIKPRLLITRIKAMLRRERSTERVPEAPGTLKIGNLEINREEYVVRKKGEVLNMPKKEFELLIFLASHPGKVYSREVLLEKVWGTNVHVVDRTIDVHIRKLRGKIGKQWIKTVQGVGYKFSEPK
jgi:two-component system alkaline phosphatase synthesis response regulator PhoP